MTNLHFKSIRSETLESGICYEHFLLENLLPGQGITIGNQLRRVLLGDLEGNAISAVRILGINHEFGSIRGVREDILEILLNLKGIVLRSKIKDSKFGRLKVQGPLIITADLIELPKGIEVVNSNHYIATISASTVLEMEFKIDYGVGYKLASQSLKKKNKDFLQMDTIFMPVQKVDFKIENVYDSNNNISERLFLEIWTNGSLTPSIAIKKACKKIIDLFKILIELQDSKHIEKSNSKSNKTSIKPYTNMTIEELQLSVRAYNCLKKAKIDTVGDLLNYSPEKLQELKNFGRKSADEVFSILKNKLGITLNSNKNS